VPKSAIALTLGADAYKQRGDPVGRRARLEEAVAIAPDFALAQFHLAILEDEEGRYDAAIARYRLALDAEPPHARDIRWEFAEYAGAARVRTGALNNLAYALAVHRNAPHEALPLAQHAVAQSPQDAMVLDTLAWVEYLDGDIQNALVHIRASLAIARTSESVQLHAAAILAASGEWDEARRHLSDVRQRRPELATSDQVTRVQAQLRTAVVSVD
jgi:tetratricopeptide (TPR) repeat protein